MINRAAIILRYKQPAIDLINAADPVQDNPGITLDVVNEDRTVYLITEEHADDPDVLEVWIRLNVEALFEDELLGWYQDDTLWPENLDYELFQSWFDVECHTVIIDTSEMEIVDDEA